MCDTFWLHEEWRLRVECDSHHLCKIKNPCKQGKYSMERLRYDIRPYVLLCKFIISKLFLNYNRNIIKDKSLIVTLYLTFTQTSENS